MTTTIRMGFHALLAGLALHLAPAHVRSQVTSPPAVAESASFGFGLHHFVSGGHPAWRLGGIVYLSRTGRLSATARFRGDDGYAEIERRWLRDSGGPFRPFVSLSGVFLKESDERSLGDAMGGGLEFYPVRRTVLELSLAWHTLLGIASSANRHGLRVSAGLSLVPFGLPG